MYIKLIWNIRYNNAGYPVYVRNRDGKWTTNTWDAAGRLTRVDYPNGDWVQKEYKGDLVNKLIDGEHNTTLFYYCHEQLTGVRFPDGSTRAAGFDNLNRQIWASDERGIAVTNNYDMLDRLTAAAYIPYEGNSSINGLPYTTFVPQSITPTTCRWNAVYGSTTNNYITYSYDKIGNVTNMTDWAGNVTNAYDSLNRVTTQLTRINASNDVIYSVYSLYDLTDNCTSETFTAHSGTFTATTRYQYDNLNRLTQIKAPLNSKTITTGYLYNDNGKRKRRSVAEDSQTAAIEYYLYDSEQRLKKIYSAHHSVEYLYDNAQRISWMYETLNSTEKRFNYLYDERDQLLEETEHMEVEDDIWFEGPPNYYTYDNAQNRLSVDRTGYTQDEDYGYSFANKMTNIWRGSSSASSRYYYDIAGNLITSIVRNATNCYYYTMQNKLAKIEGTNFVYEFRYNSRNERIAIGKAVNGADISWRYDACNGPVCIAEFDESADVDTYFVRGNGIAQGIGDIIAEVNYDGTSEEIHYYLYNHRGDVVCVVNPGSTPNTTYRYDAYGKCYENYGSYTSRYTFSTKEFLPDANLYLYQYRVYDPQAGRWTQRDPIDYQDSINLYQFCGNNPVNNVDAYGMEDEPTEKTQAEKDAEVPFGETANVFPQKTKEGKGTSIYKRSTDDPDSKAQLQEARSKMVIVSKRNSRVNRKDGSSATDVAKPVWNDCVEAAENAQNMTLPDNVKNFYLYQEGKDPPDTDYGDTAHTYTRYKVYGPFRKKGDSGDVSEGDKCYIVFYEKAPKPKQK